MTDIVIDITEIPRKAKQQKQATTPPGIVQELESSALYFLAEEEILLLQLSAERKEVKQEIIFVKHAQEE